MRLSHLILVVAASSASFPATARNGAAYLGVEGGILLPMDTRYRVDSTRVQTVPTGSGLLGQTVTTTNATFGSGFVADYKNGVDLDVIGGYDFGLIRLEGELGYKRTRLRKLTASSTLVAATNTAPISGVTPGSFAFGNRATILSAMVNGLVDHQLLPMVGIYGGAGAGRARVKTLGDRDSAFAWQLIGGLSTPITQALDLGLKYRYFQTRKLRFDSAASFSGAGGSTSNSTFSKQGRFQSHSVLATLVVKFGGVAAVAPVPPLSSAGPPPPAPRDMQVCADGSMIDVTAVCSAPPPPPPPPPMQGERG